MLTLEVIDNGARFQEFQPEWSNFLGRVPPVTPFQRPEWLATWWSHFGSGTLRVMVFRHEAEVAGILPCFLHEWNGRRQSTLIGSGISDYLDPPFDPECIPALIPLIRAELHNRNDWDLCDWQDLSRDTPLQSLGTVVEETPCTLITLGDQFETFLSARPKDLRRNLRRYKQKAEAMGPVTFETVDRADPELLDALVNLHGARWAKSGESGMIEANRSEPFLRDIAKRLAVAGLLRIFTVRFTGRIVAILMALCDNAIIYSYLSAFDPQYEEFGFGRELLAQAMQYAHERGYGSWNFLRGDEPYKFSWGAQAVAKCRVIIRR